MIKSQLVTLEHSIKLQHLPLTCRKKGKRRF